MKVCLKYLTILFVVLIVSNNSCHTYVAVPLTGDGHMQAGVSVQGSGSIAALTLLGVLVGTAIYNDSQLDYSSTCKVKINIKPGHASVFLDGVYIGMADEFNGHPANLSVTKGNHNLVFKAKGYKNYNAKLSMRNGMTARISKTMIKSSIYNNQTSTTLSTDVKPIFKELRLELNLSPDNAEVAIDGVLIGTAKEIHKLHGPLIIDGKSKKMTISFRTEHEIYDLQKLAKTDGELIKIKIHFTEDIYE